VIERAFKASNQIETADRCRDRADEGEPNVLSKLVEPDDAAGDREDDPA
jgi:hypothetical protein